MLPCFCMNNASIDRFQLFKRSYWGVRVRKQIFFLLGCPPTNWTNWPSRSKACQYGIQPFTFIVISNWNQTTLNVNLQLYHDQDIDEINLIANINRNQINVLQLIESRRDWRPTKFELKHSEKLEIGMQRFYSKICYIVIVFFPHCFLPSCNRFGYTLYLQIERECCDVNRFLHVDMCPCASRLRCERSLGFSVSFLECLRHLEIPISPCCHRRTHTYEKPINKQKCQISEWGKEQAENTSTTKTWRHASRRRLSRV